MANIANSRDYIHKDKLLTNFGTQYQLRGLVGDFVAPFFTVKNISDVYVQYTKDLYRVYDNAIGEREEPREIFYEVNEESYRCREYGLSTFISKRKMNNADEPINLMKDRTKRLKKAQALARENRVLELATSAAVPRQSGTSNWRDQTNGTPVADLINAKKEIFLQTGEDANAMVVPYELALEAIKTLEWRDYFKYTDSTVGNQFDFMKGTSKLGLEVRISGTMGNVTNLNGVSDPEMEPLLKDEVIVFNREASPSLESRAFMFSPGIYKDVMKREERSMVRGVKMAIFEDIDELLVDPQGGLILEAGV